MRVEALGVYLVRFDRWSIPYHPARGSLGHYSFSGHGYCYNQITRHLGFLLTAWGRDR